MHRLKTVFPVLAAILCSLFFFFAGNIINPDSLWAAPSISSSSDAEKDDYHLINDTADVYTAESKNAAEEELKKIFSSTTDKMYKPRVYTFIYDSMNKDIDSVKDDLIAKADLPSDVFPIIFLYNTADNTYKFIIDTQIKSFVSMPYLKNQVTTIFTDKNKVTDDDFNEFLFRFSTILVASINENISNGDKIDDPDHFETRNFSSTGTSSSSNVQQNNPSSKPASSHKDNSSITLAVCCALIFVMIAGAVVWKRRLKKRNQRF